ncbi:MAG: hypothetical protein KDC53_01115 [Saprospiraceae bacterium]|nr:hypothetical protein [Saprospiraceae bacterium]
MRQIQFIVLAFGLSFTNVFSQHNSHILFNTDFEGGNLGTVEELSTAHYRIHLTGEADWQKRNRQVSWYYFQINGARNQELTLELTDLVGEYNFQPGAHAITEYTPPVYSYDQQHWMHFSDEQVSWREEEKELILKITPDKNQIWIAHQPPYTSQNLIQFLSQHPENVNFMMDTIGMTMQHRPMLLLSIGSPEYQSKKVIWLMARQHAWESGTSWVMQSLLSYLLDSAAGQSLQKDFTFKIFPMADPDGVARGGVRFNQFGHDLNRNWDLVNAKEMPEISMQKSAIQAWLKRGHKIDFFLTLHNTESSDYIQGPSLESGKSVWKNMVTNSSFEAPEGLREIRPSVDPGRMTVYENLWSEFGIPAYLMELKVEKVNKLGRHREIQDWLDLGPAIVRAIVSGIK